MLFDSNSWTLEAIASVALAIGVASAYFFGPNLKGLSETGSREALTERKATTSAKKKKRVKNETDNASKSAEEPNLPGGNKAFSKIDDMDETFSEDASLIVASLEAAAVAQENRKSKKSKKRTKGNALKQPQQQQPSQSPKSTAAPTRKKATIVQSSNSLPEDESEWRVVDRSRKKDTAAGSQASFTTVSATDPGSPELNISPIRANDDVKIETRVVIAELSPGVDGSFKHSATMDLTGQRTTEEIGDEPIPSPLVNSLDLGRSSDVGYEESTEDDGFIPVKSKGRKRTQRSTSAQSVGSGGSAIRASESMTKKQRQNKAKREAEKTAKVEGEQQRLEMLSRHKKELENVRIDQMYKKGKQLSGGMSMSVGESGKAEWD